MGRRLCAWCKKVLEENVEDIEGDTHGICEECARKEIEEAEQKQKAASKKES